MIDTVGGLRLAEEQKKNKQDDAGGVVHRPFV
jgi:hypothetical protein